jgi:hypothetical protein
VVSQQVEWLANRSIPVGQQECWSIGPNRATITGKGVHDGIYRVHLANTQLYIRCESSGDHRRLQSRHPTKSINIPLSLTIQLATFQWIRLTNLYRCQLNSAPKPRSYRACCLFLPCLENLHFPSLQSCPAKSGEDWHQATRLVAAAMMDEVAKPPLLFPFC